MSLYNTANINEKSSFSNAVINSLPSLNGLWFLKNINNLDKKFIENMDMYSYHEIIFTVIKTLNIIKLNDNDLKKIIKKAFNFPINIKKFNNICFLETFHGPTLTFKDFGARFLAEYVKLISLHKKYNVLVSTSGDTGSAIASAFYKSKNINVTILYPYKRVSDMQEKQITTYSNNVMAYAFDGNFDDCQKFVKKAFVDKDIEYLNLISANSINIARLIPQTIYYFYAYSVLKKYNKDIIFSVPCGNCGNLTGGLIAKRMGLPISFIASQNDNNVFIKYLKTGKLEPIKSYMTISNAMDVGNPSNVMRIRYMYNNNIAMMRKDIMISYSTEKRTIDGIREVYRKYKYIIDPHTAVGYNGVLDNIDNNKLYVIVSTAHPSKFNDVIFKALYIHAPIPKRLSNLDNICREYFILKNDYNIFKKNIKLINKSGVNITFIGMPGAGKSTLAKYIQDNYNYKLIELDNYIEKKNNATLFELIKKYGDEGFKIIEETACLSIPYNKNNIVVSTGGSIIYSDKSMKYMRNNNNIIIYLKTDFNTIKERTNNFTNRGIVFNNMTPKELYDSRDKLYTKYCNLIIDTSNKDVSFLANMFRYIMNPIKN